ncbi:MAG: hypothetical protein ABI579_00760 [Candidatus Sumerlaeota bacterium]
MRNMVKIVGIVAAALAATAASAVPTTLDLPARQAGAMTGSEFHTFLAGMTTAQREAAVYTQIAAGNIPPFMRNLKAVPVSTTGHTGTIYVTADYISIGSDADYFRMPMSLTLAAQVATLCNSQLPTPKMVDHIRDAATIRIAPVTETPDASMITEPIFWKQNERVDAQLTAFTQGGLIAGDKKDVVSASKLLADNPSPPPVGQLGDAARVAIYGWPYLNNSNIQGLVTVHEEAYHDYSHGIRLVSQFMIYDGAETTVSSVLNDPARKAILSAETTPVAGLVYYPSRADNGCFEGTVSGTNVSRAWTAWSAPGSAAITYARGIVNHNDGDFSQNWNRADTQAFSGGVYQTITVLPGYTYQLRATMKRQSSFVGNDVAFGYDLTGGTNGVLGSIVWTDLTGGIDNVWNTMTASFIATGQTVTLFARGGHSGTTGDTNADYYLDSVALYIASATSSNTPTPSPSPSISPTASLTPAASPSMSPSPSISPSPTASPAAEVGFKLN